MVYSSRTGTSHHPPSPRVRCPQPWPRTTSHVPDGGAAGTVSAALSARIRLQRPPAPTPFTTCTPQPVPCCAAAPKSLPTASVVVASERIPGSTAARHAHGAILRVRVLPERTLTARPSAFLHGAPCGAHILQRHEPLRASLTDCRYLIAVQHTAQHFLPPPRPSLTSCRRDCMNACGGCPHAAAPLADVRALARAPVQGPSSSR